MRVSALLMLACWLSANESKRERGKRFETIILVGLPKSGTTAVHEALLEMGVASVHHHVEEHIHNLCPRDEFPIEAVWVGGNATRKTYWHDVPAPMHHCYVGTIVQRALLNELPPLEYMIEKGFRAFCQLDVCYPPAVCVFPQLEAIEEITLAYPDAHYLHTRRMTVDVHVGSLTAWKPQVDEDSLIDRLRETGYLSLYPSQSANQSEVDNLKHFVREATRETLHFFEKRPQLRFLDVTIEDPQAADKIGLFWGIQNFTLAKANTGHYHDGVTASPTSANFTTMIGIGGDDGMDDDGRNRNEAPAPAPISVPLPASVPIPVPVEAKGKGAKKGKNKEDDDGDDDKEGTPKKQPPTQHQTAAGTSSASRRPAPSRAPTQSQPPLPDQGFAATLALTHIDVPSALVGAAVALLLVRVCAACVDSLRAVRTALGGSGIISGSVAHKAVYSPVPLRESDGDDADVEGHAGVELIRRSRRVGVDEDDDEFGLGEEES